ncbi:MAG TPA: protein translocase subunit SecD, partial [Chlamydiales bacterium]
MEKKRKSQFILILTVLSLTVYNVLPTLFYYSKPLDAPVSSELAEATAGEITKRVDGLKEESIDWLSSYCTLLNIKPVSIEAKGTNLLSIVCTNSSEVALLQRFLPKAGSLIPFAPAQLTPLVSTHDPKELLVERKIGASLDGLFEFVPKLSERYTHLLQERAEAIRACFSAPSSVSLQIQFLHQDLSKTTREEILLSIASSIAELAKVHAKNPQFAKRLAESYTPPSGIQKFLDLSAIQRDDLKKEGSEERKELRLAAAEQFVKAHKALFVFSEKNPVFHDILIDSAQERLLLKFHSDLSKVKDPLIEQRIWAEIAHIAKETQEDVVRVPEGLAIAFHQLPQTTGLLVLKLDLLGEKQAQILKETIQTLWRPKHPDLRNIPVVSAAEYEALTPAQKALCLLISAEQGTLKVRLKGLDRIAKAYEEASSSALAQAFANDARDLTTLLWQQGVVKYPESESGVFEQRDWFSSLLAATREQFHVYGNKQTAWLELSNVEQRIFATNQIETKIQEDLLKWEDEYRRTQISMDPITRLEVPEPTRSSFWSNLSLTLRKLWRGDEKKILRWGLDLSGGKTVQIELRDKQNRLVSDEISLKQGINELFDRVNKMGVSDVSIRQVGSHIALDFPGSQPLRASELIKASSMTFHVVNERFHTLPAHQFLQEVWNEAIASHQKDPQSIQRIAYKQLHEGPQSASAQALLESGLKLAHPDEAIQSSSFNESLSKVVLKRDDTRNPLEIVFANHALEGSELENIQSNYDPAKGNYLSFSVKKPSQEKLFAWTSRFSKERIAGTSYDILPEGQGWHMAVLLNGTLISAPNLVEPIKSEASISGHFTHREVMQLVHDLKTGSLSFTPRILFEKNVSPELGQKDRMQGIAATLFALVLVVFAMVLYYRFAGIIASIAVLFNLLILWAVLQNLGASLSLAGLAGVILTVGMAVDANVLVFERIKEEFASSGRIASAIQAGYKKAFSAIVDSNITTIIAALILLNFDAGPIKAFAVSMIIGIASSMFTALFMTRFYFEGWVKNPKHTHLSMSNWIANTHFDFLKKARVAFGIAVVVIGAGSALL